MLRQARYALAIFVSAFLLFSVQPIIARYILPWFGGGAAVWAACLLFFQVVLLCGYAYAYGLARFLSLRKQAVVHLLLLAISVIVLPITPGPEWKPAGGDSPTLSILLLLVAAVGLPSFLVATTAPLLQSWFSRTHASSPYRLYALSNVGSLLGLATYPFAVEPHMGLRVQTLGWSAVYILFVVSCGWCAVWILRHENSGPSAAREAPAPRPARSTRVLWLALSAFGVILLMASTNELTKNVSPIPFLWVLPLAIYLSTFIVCFADRRWYRRRTWIAVFCLTLIPTLWLSHVSRAVGIPPLIVMHSLTLLAGCMVCHGELADLKPDKSRLTGFYLIVATGGVAGGAFVTIAAPAVFTRFWELPIGLIGAFLLGGICLSRRSGIPGQRRALGVVWVVVAGFLGYVASMSARSEDSYIASVRNAYGRISVSEKRDGGQLTRFLVHGRVRHGSQRRDPAQRRTPTLYYTEGTGIQLAIEHHEHPAGLKMAVIGLGAGTLAAYGSPGDEIRFYEINPAVDEFARTHFSYLSDSDATCHVVIGDARVSLERELEQTGSHQLDIVVLDAFSGEAIPVHLLTREAVALYIAHLSPGGVLAVNITNSYLDLSPVVRGLAKDAGMTAALIRAEPNELSPAASTWMLMSSDAGFLGSEHVAAAASPPPSAREIVWTDDYSNLFRVLR